MKLLNDRVLIKELKTENKTSSGIILQNNDAEKIYEVVSVGAKCQKLEIGDKIKLHEHSHKVQFDDYYFINQQKDIKVYL